MSLLTRINHIGESRRQIDIKSFGHNYLDLGKNEYRAVLQVGSINFELKSELEQDTLLLNYLKFINSLPCSIQILVRVRSFDINNYIDDFKINNKKNKNFKGESYIKFINDQIKSKKILTRKFYLIVSAKNKDKDLVLNQLNHNCEIISKNLKKLGLWSQRLNSLETIDLFYSFFNPRQAKLQPISAATLKLLNKFDYL